MKHDEEEVLAVIRDGYRRLEIIPMSGEWCQFVEGKRCACPLGVYALAMNLVEPLPGGFGYYLCRLCQHFGSDWVFGVVDGVDNLERTGNTPASERYTSGKHFGERLRAEFALTGRGWPVPPATKGCHVSG